MRRPSLWCFASSTALLLLGSMLGPGCTSGNTSSTAVYIPATLSDQLAAAFCGWQAQCCAGLASDAAAGTQSDGSAAAGISCADAGGAPPSDAASGECLNRASLATAQQLALVTAAFYEGLLGIDQTVAMACVAAYQNRACSAGPTDALPDVQSAVADPACAALFVGNIPEGERCDMTAECLAGTFCLSQGTGVNMSSLGGGASLGICFPYEGMGGICNSAGDCEPPYTCDPTTFTCG